MTLRGEGRQFCRPGGEAYKATAVLCPDGGDGTASNHTVNVADKGAKENTEERGSDVIQEDKEQTSGGPHWCCWHACAMAIHRNGQLQM